MSSLTLLQSLHENLASRAQVKSVFGDAVTAGEKTIIPVAKIAYGFGAGAGRVEWEKRPGPKAKAEVEAVEFAPYRSAFSKSAPERPASSRFTIGKRRSEPCFSVQSWACCLPNESDCADLRRN